MLVIVSQAHVNKSTNITHRQNSLYSALASLAADQSNHALIEREIIALNAQHLQRL